MGTTDETGQSHQNISFSFSPVAKNGEVVDESQPGWQQEHSGKARAVRLPTASGQASGRRSSLTGHCPARVWVAEGLVGHCTEDLKDMRITGLV